jgi:hypothetical protein
MPATSVQGRLQVGGATVLLQKVRERRRPGPGNLKKPRTRPASWLSDEPQVEGYQPGAAGSSLAYGSRVPEERLKLVLKVGEERQSCDTPGHPDAFRRIVRRFTRSHRKSVTSSGRSSIRRRHMTKLALLIFLAAAASVHARDTKDVRRDVFDVCNQFVINEPDEPISFGFTRDCILYDPNMNAPEWLAW